MGSDDCHHFTKKRALKRRKKNSREYKDSILIICEGSETEVKYFKSFPVTNIKVETIGTGRNTISLISEAIEIWKGFADDHTFYERLWCVFDRDDFPLQNYNEAFDKIEFEEQKLNKKFKKQTKREIKISIAYSNQAFELWYLLHYDYITASIDRSEYKRMLTKRMGKKYRKNDPDIYGLLKKLSDDTHTLQGQTYAISNAKKLYSSIKGLKHNHNPSTTIHLLVEELNKYLKK